MKNLCSDVIIGHDFLELHSSLKISFGGPKPTLNICGLLAGNVQYPSLFNNLSPDCKPIAIKSRKYSSEDKYFIKKEITRMLAEGIIETSESPWRAQVVVTSSENHKRRLAIDYSQTINRFTNLDAYPLPKIDETISEIAKYRVYSTLDLRSAYHQVAIKPVDRPYTAFEANGRLYQFKRIPFGVTNGVASFQRIMDKIITDEKLEGTFAYIDNVTVCGNNYTDHDRNLKKFMAAVEKYNLTLNKDKCFFGVDTINLLGYTVKKGSMSPDPERLKPLLKLPIPDIMRALKRALGMFAHYSQWIASFSNKIRPLVQTNSFPLSSTEKKP